MTSNSFFAAWTRIAGVVVTKESDMSSYFPEAGKLNGSYVDMCSYVAGPSISGLGDLFELSYLVLLLFPHY